MTADEARRSLSTLLQERLRLEGLLFTGIGALAEGGHLKALEAARSVLKEEPDNAKALELEKAALLSQHPESSPDALATQKRALGDWMADQRRTVRLEELLLKWPSQSFWTRLAALRAAPTTLPAERGEAYVRSVAAQATVTGTFESAPLTEVLRSLEAQAALEILLDSALRASVPAPTVRRLDARGMSLTTALDAIAADGGWAWLVAGDVLRVVPRSVEGSTDRTGAPRVQRYYDVSDLLAPGTGTPSSTAAMGESKKAFASIDAILRSLRAEVEPSVWRDDSVAKLEAVGQTLVVRASVEIHDAVRAWLARQR